MLDNYVTYKEFVLHPVIAFFNDWPLKFVLSLISTALVASTTKVLGLYAELFRAEPLLILLLLTLMGADLVAGVYRSLVNNVGFSPKRLMRGATVKLLEYLGVCYILIGISNAFDDLPVVGPVVAELGSFALFWACWTEGVSVIENLTGSTKILQRIMRVVKTLKPENRETFDALEERNEENKHEKA